MTRSADALARRAEKRGLPVPSLVRADGKEKNSVEAPAKKARVEPAAVSAPKPQAPSSGFHWMCSMCKNRNITKLAPTCCNRCQRDRAEADESYSSSVAKSAAPPAKQAQAVRAESVAKPASSSSATPKPQATSSSTHWMCSMCKNRNITALAPTNCNRCQRDRSEVAEVASAVASADSSLPAKSPSTSEARKPVREKTPSMLAAQKLVAESRAWSIKAPSQADLLKNDALREAYNDEEKIKELSEEDKARAEILIARSKRKKEKKQEMKNAGYRFTSNSKYKGKK
jgi:hypothetical protein